MRYWQVTIPFLALLLTGCVYLLEPSERFYRLHYVVRADKAGELDGPYKVQRVLSSTAILAEHDGQMVTVVMRGCRSSGEPSVDQESKTLLGTLWPHDVYLRRDCSQMISSGVVAGVVYQPCNRIHAGKDDKGDLRYDIVDYKIKPLLLLLSGYLIFDHSDTNYPLYELFAQAERYAKRNREGHWSKKRAVKR